jgi:hypothetical protein
MDEDSDFCAFFGSAGYSVEDFGYWCFDEIDGFTLVTRRVCAGRSGSFDSGAGEGFAVGN